MTKVIIGIAGEIASGKGTVAKYLKDKHQASLHRFSTMLRDILKRMSIEENRENMQKVSLIMRQAFGEDSLAKAIFGEVNGDSSSLVVVDGVRRFPDVKYLVTLPEFRLIYIEAEAKKRFERLRERGENTDDGQKTFEEFEKDGQGEAESQIRSLKERSAFVINNDGNLEDLYSQIENILRNI